MPAWQPLNKFRNWWRQWSGQARWEKVALASLGWRLPAVWVLVRVFDFNKTTRIIEAETSPFRKSRVPAGLAQGDYAQRCAQLTEIAARHGLYQANCLHQSLALCHFLRRNGLEARLKIGVLPGAKSLLAHAWVELDGRPLGQQSTESYHAFERLAQANRAVGTSA